MHAHLEKHGDAVKDIAFKVDDVTAVWTAAVQQGAVSVERPTINRGDGLLMTAVIAAYGDTTHTLVQRAEFHGTFMPGYRLVEDSDPLLQVLPEIPIRSFRILYCPQRLSVIGDAEAMGD